MTFTKELHKCLSQESKKLIRDSMGVEVGVGLAGAPSLQGETKDQLHHVQAVMVTGHLYRLSECNDCCFPCGFPILGKFVLCPDPNVQPYREGNSGK